MKVLNIVLSIVILLLAAVSAVSAYLLWEKRTTLTTGWDKMATAVNKASAAMDRDSGTNYAADLSKQKLSHENYAELESLLAKLDKQTKDFVAQRNALADALRVNGVATEMKNLPADTTFRDLAKYDASKDAVVNGVADFVKNRNVLIAGINNSARTLGVTVNTQTLKTNAAAGIAPFNTRVAAVKAQIDAYNKAMTNVASLAGAARPTFTDSGYAASLVKVTDAVRALRDKQAETLASLEKARKALAAAEREIKAREGQIGVLNASINGKADEIAALRAALGVGKDFQAWTAGSPESRRQVRGVVTEVNEKFGFIAVNVGSNTVVKQAVGDDKLLEINPKIASGMDMYVVRDFDDNKAVKYVAKIKLTTVDGDCSIAEVQEKGENGPVQVGDEVVLNEGYPLLSCANTAKAK